MVVTEVHGFTMKKMGLSKKKAGEKHHRMTLKGLADVDAGRLHDHAEIEKWAAGLRRPK